MDRIPVTCVCLCFPDNSATFDIKPQEYMPYLGSKAGLHVVVTGQTEEDKVSEMLVVHLKPPNITITVRTNRKTLSQCGSMDKT